MMNVVVLISGRGSNLEALLNHQEGYQVTHVVSNKATAKGLDIARGRGITNTYINWRDQQQAELMLSDLLSTCQPDLVVLAGFMRILSTGLVNQFKNKMINIHPSLLPKYPGLNTHRQVLKNNDPIHGATVHLVTDQLDQGKILAQTRMTVNANWNEDQLAAALLAKEHELLTRVVGQMASQDAQQPKSEQRNTTEDNMP